MRELENDITGKQINDNMRIYYNSIREHSALDGKTLNEIAGIDLELGKNKWVGLIKQSL